MNLNKFKSTLTAIARPTLFNVQISGAPVQSISADHMKFTCKAASLPASTFGNIEVPFYARKVNFNGDRTYSEWTTTIIADNSWTLYKQIFNWHVKMNHPSDNVASSTNMNSFKADGLVTMYDAAGSPTLQFKLIGLYPLELQQLDIDWGNNDTTADIMVTWRYDWTEML